jgi:hypothetical protein
LANFRYSQLPGLIEALESADTENGDLKALIEIVYLKQLRVRVLDYVLPMELKYAHRTLT